MVVGKNEDCSIEWFHTECLRITVMLRMVRLISDAPGLCTAATDSPPGPSMDRRWSPLGPSVAPQIVPRCHDRSLNKIKVSH